MSLKSLLPFAKYAGSVLLCIILYQGLFSWLLQLVADTRFLTNMLQGAIAQTIALVAFYWLASRFVFPDAPRKNGLIIRYILFLASGLAALCAISWLLQDCAGVPVFISRAVAGIAIVVPGWFVLDKLVFLSRRGKRRAWVRGLRNVAASAVLGLCVFGAMFLCTTNIKIYMDYANVGQGYSEIAANTLEESHHESKATIHANIDALGVSYGAPGVDFDWDDEWFFADPTAFNHGLAKAGIVLSAAVNNESDHDAAGKSEAANLFTQMGFDSLSLASYKHHSDMVENLANMTTGATDTVSYAMATKKIKAKDGRKKTLIAIAIRGSYGTEWLSNFNISGTNIPGYEGDHVGFAGATIGALEALDKELETHKGEETVVFICGHSRGGAVANLMAAKLDQRAKQADSGELLPGQVYAYAFATPVNTTNDDATAKSYANIFNLINPSDIVPQLPLPQWGYTRYGISYTLPRFSDSNFETSYERMKQFYRTSFAQESPSEPRDAASVDRACQELYEAIPSAADIGSPDSLFALFHMLVCDVNPLQVLSSHYLPTYIGWVFTTDASELVRG